MLALGSDQITDLAISPPNSLVLNSLVPNSTCSINEAASSDTSDSDGMQ